MMLIVSLQRDKTKCLRDTHLILYSFTDWATCANQKHVADTLSFSQACFSSFRRDKKHACETHGSSQARQLRRSLTEWRSSVCGTHTLSHTGNISWVG